MSDTGTRTGKKCAHGVELIEVFLPIGGEGRREGLNDVKAEVVLLNFNARTKNFLEFKLIHES